MFNKVFKAGIAIVKKNEPAILIGLGTAGMLVSTYLAVKETPKALKLIEAKKEELEVEELPAKEVVKTTWKCYAPAVVTTVVSVGCILGGSDISGKRYAALATAYSISENARKEFKEKAVEVIGEKKVEKIKDEIAKDKLEKDPIKTNEVVITDKGKHLVYDSISGRYFISDIESIRQIENKLNRDLIFEMYVSLNDLYFELEIPPTQIGDELGWNVEDGEIRFEFSSQIAANGEPCLVLSYDIAPRRDYRNLH